MSSILQAVPHVNLLVIAEKRQQMTEVESYTIN